MSLEAVQSECYEQLKKLDRTRESLKILAVSKLQTLEKIRSLYTAGHTFFAENYVQEALQKQEELKHLQIEWHFIGSLQKNKVKLVVGKFALIHSVDSVELARAISHQAEKISTTQKILLQVNLAQEATKGGFDRESARIHWPEIRELPGIEVIGLMTMPPLTEDPEDVRLYFRDLKTLLGELSQLGTGKHHLQELSMGTSHDYLVAIEEGATIVRLGTILFGERPKKK